MAICLANIKMNIKGVDGVNNNLTNLMSFVSFKSGILEASTFLNDRFDCLIGGPLRTSRLQHSYLNK
jgi:hypothetical protein